MVLFYIRSGKRCLKICHWILGRLNCQIFCLSVCVCVERFHLYWKQPLTNSKRVCESTTAKGFFEYTLENGINYSKIKKKKTHFKRKMTSTTEKIRTLETEIDQLSKTLDAKRNELGDLRRSLEHDNTANKHILTNLEISRFSRQIILPEVGVRGQIKLKNAKVLIVGAGGLGESIEFIAFVVRSMSTLTYM